MMKCKFYREVDDRRICKRWEDDDQECVFEPANEDECYERYLPKTIEYGSSDAYKDEDEFSKKYCKWCSSLVCSGVRDTVAREGCKHYQYEMKKERQASENDVVANKPPIKLELVQYPYSKSGPTVYLDDWLIAGPRAFGVGKTVASYELTEGNLKDIQRIVERELNRLNEIE